MGKSFFVKGTNYLGKTDKFLPIEDRLKINRIMADAVDTTAAVVLWTAGQEVVVHAKITDQFSPKSHVYIKADNEQEIGRLLKHLMNNNTADCQMLIYQPNRAVIGFKCAVLGSDENGLKIKVPELIYRVQRRQHQRYKIRKGYTIYAEYRDPQEDSDDAEILKKPILDISVGGMAVLISEEEKDHYHVGMIMNDIEIEIRNRRLSVNAKVQNLIPLKGDSENTGLQIGCAFTQISFDDVEFLSFYIGENTAHFS